MKLKNLLFIFLSILIVVGCSKEETNEPIISYPTIVGEWAIVKFNQTVISDGTVDETQSVTTEYPGTMKFLDNGAQVIDLKGLITENTYTDRGDEIIVKGVGTEIKYMCRQRSQNQLVFDVTEKVGSSLRKQSYVLERTTLEDSGSLVGSWLVVRLERLTKQAGQLNETTTLNYAGTVDFLMDGNYNMEINHQMSHFTYIDRGSYILVKDKVTNEEVRYSVRIRTTTKLVFDAVISKTNQETRETYILEKLQIIPNPSDLIGGWLIVRYDYTELNNGVINNNKTVSLNSPGIIYFNKESKETLVLNGVTYHNTYFDYGSAILFNDGVSDQNVIYTIRHRTANLLLIERSENVNGLITNQSFVLEKHTLVGSWNIDCFDQIVKHNGVIDNAQTVTRYNCGSVNYKANGQEVLYLSGVSYINTYVDLGEILQVTDQFGSIWNYTFAKREKNKIVVNYSGTIDGVERIQTYDLTRY